MQLCLSQACTLAAPFATDVEDYAAAHAPGIELWLTKVEEFLANRPAAVARELLAQHGLSAPAAAMQGGLLTSQGEARREAWALFERRLALCRELGAATLVVACDTAPPLAAQDLERLRFSLREAARLAGAQQVRVALEFQARAAIGNNLQTAAALVAEAESPHLGLCLDAFHYYVGPSKTEDLGCLTAENLFHVQLCDLADRPRELAADGDRILPGEGDIPLAPVLARLREIGYAGAVSVELFNPVLWQTPPRQFAEIAATALRRLMGEARRE